MKTGRDGAFERHVQVRRSRMDAARRPAAEPYTVASPHATGEPCTSYDSFTTAKRRAKAMTRATGAAGRARSLAFWAAALAILAALLAPSALAHADTVSGRAFVGGSWYAEGQSYFSITIEGHATVGWCLNRGAARPLSGWYGYTAQRSVSGAGGTTDLWLEGSLSPVSYDAATGVSRTSSVTFRAGTSNAYWDVTTPAGITLFVNGTAHAPGASVRVLPGQSVHLETTDPLSIDNGACTVSLEGTAHADASVTTTYRNIVITPPGAWDGVSYYNGLPAGYQRVGVGPLSFSTPRTNAAVLRSSAQLAATARYFVDNESTPCFAERLAVGSTFKPSPRAEAAGEKPDCTPGLDAWYWEDSCENPVDPFVVAGDFDVHGRNLATLRHAPAANSALQHGTLARSSPNESAPEVALASLLPADRVLPWGTVASLERVPANVLYLHDGERWRTLRRPDEGWHRTESALDDAVGAVRIERDTTVYDYWTKSTYDGVLDW